MFGKLSRTGRLLGLVLMLSTAACDHVTKRIAAKTLAGTVGRSYWGGIFRLEYAENPGAFLSLGSGMPDWARVSVLTIGAAIGVVVIGIAAYRLRWTGPGLVGAMLFISGGISNLIDRVLRGRVVDFMSIGIGPVRTGIFNLADIALVFGVVLICFCTPSARSAVPSEKS